VGGDDGVDAGVITSIILGVLVLTVAFLLAWMLVKRANKKPDGVVTAQMVQATSSQPPQRAAGQLAADAESSTTRSNVTVESVHPARQEEGYQVRLFDVSVAVEDNTSPERDFTRPDVTPARP